MKSNIKTVIAFILGVIISGATVYAAVTATSITYEPSWTKINGDPISNVSEAIDTLYTKATSSKTPTQVATLTTQGATYTMQNDGYITGTAQTPTNYSAILKFNDENVYICPGDTSSTCKVSVYVPEGTTVTTRSDHGTYNLTVYEWN